MKKKTIYIIYIGKRKRKIKSEMTFKSNLHGICADGKLKNIILPTFDCVYFKIYHIFYVKH